MPVTDQSEHEQKNGNQQQACGFRGVDCVAMLLVVGIIAMPAIVNLRGGHADIVARYIAPDAHVGETGSGLRVGGRGRPPLRWMGPVLHYGVVHARAAKQQQNRALWSV